MSTQSDSQRWANFIIIGAIAFEFSVITIVLLKWNKILNPKVRRTKKIIKEFKRALDSTINATKEILVNAQKRDVIYISIDNIEGVAVFLVSKANGLGLLLEQYPYLVENEIICKKDKKICLSVPKME